MSVIHPKDIAAELGRFAFFSGFPEDSLLIFSTMAIPLKIEKGQFLLEQGKSNDSLFFLRSGQLEIYVDGENIFELSLPGEVVGEMSLINRKPVTASVKAKSNIEVFKVSEAHLKGLKSHERERFQQLLYQVYAIVLAQRLSNTNDKAKKFEIAHRELEQTHEELRKLNENLEKQIARRSSELVQKVRDLIESHLQPAQTTLSKWSQNENQAIPFEEIQKLLRSTNEVVDFLKPVAEFGQKGKSTIIRKILLCDTDKKQQIIAKLALGGTGVELNVVSTMEELEQNIKSHEFDLALCNAEMKEAIHKIIQMNPRLDIALLVNLDMNFYLQTLKDFPDQQFFVSRDLNNRTFTIKNISTTVSKILNQDFFGMDKYLSWGAHIVARHIQNSEQRLEFIENMKSHFKSFGVRSSILENVHIVTEELLMNSIYDAPVDKQKKSLFNHLPRTEKIHLDKEQQATLSYGTDGVLLAVSVSDPFGSLSKEIIMKYLESCYTGLAGSLNAEKGGAGRGLHMIIESADLTIFNVKKYKQTEIICLFNLEKNKDEELHPTFHIFLS